LSGFANPPSFAVWQLYRKSERADVSPFPLWRGNCASPCHSGLFSLAPRRAPPAADRVESRWGGDRDRPDEPAVPDHLHRCRGRHDPSHPSAWADAATGEGAARGPWPTHRCAAVETERGSRAPSGDIARQRPPATARKPAARSSAVSDDADPPKIAAE